MTKNMKALIYGATEDLLQSVRFEFEHYEIKKWFGEETTIFVTLCKVLDPIRFKPTDLETDLSVAIAERLGESPNDIRFEFPISYTVKPHAAPRMVVNIETNYGNQPLFI